MIWINFYQDEIEQAFLKMEVMLLVNFDLILSIVCASEYHWKDFCNTLEFEKISVG